MFAPGTGTPAALEPETASLRVPLHPAALFACALALGFGLQALMPLSPLSDSLGLRLAVGTGISFLAVALGAWALRSLRRAGQAPDFGVAVSRLVREGPYRYSRNPLYVALVLVYAGIAVSLASIWSLAMLPLLFAALDRLVVAREERFLAGRFGDVFEEYRQSVRRWL